MPPRDDRFTRQRGRRTAGHPGSGERRRRPSVEQSRYEPVHLSDDVVKELRATARPGKGDILVKVFADAGGAFVAEDYGEAIRLGEQAKHIALRSATVRELLGLAYYRAGRWKEAARELTTFRRVAGATDQNPVIADCYRAMGNAERAIKLCDEIDARGVPAGIYYEGAIVAAGALADLGRIDEAIARLEHLELQPDNVEEHHLRAWYALADLLERRGRFTQAREWFEAVAMADPDATDAPDRVATLGKARGQARKRS